MLADAGLDATGIARSVDEHLALHDSDPSHDHSSRRDPPDRTFRLLRRVRSHPLLQWRRSAIMGTRIGGASSDSGKRCRYRGAPALMRTTTTMARSAGR